MIERSQHPVDRLIRELIQTGRPATSEEIDQIVERMATAPFDRRAVPVPRRLRGLTYRGRALGQREDSLTLHLFKRVVDEQQWAVGTTAAVYLNDLRRGVRSPAARLAIYERRGGIIAVSVIATSGAVPASRLAGNSLPNLIVVYSLDRSIILSGYQFSTLEQTGVPEEVRWLR